MPRTLSEQEFNALKAKVLASLPDNIREDEFDRVLQPRLAAAIGEAENSPAPVTGSAAGRFLSGAGEMLNPVTMATGVYQAVRHPIDTVTGIVGQMGEQLGKAGEAAKQTGQRVMAGDLPGAAAAAMETGGRAAAGAIPVIGPLSASIAERIVADPARGLGQAAGVLAPFAADKALTMRSQAMAGKKAPLLVKEAEQQVSQRVLAPGNPAYRGRAAAIAPEVLARKLTGDRLQLSQAAEEGMADAGAKLDDAIQAAGGPQAPVPISGVLAKVDQRIAELQDSKGNPLSDAAARRISALNQRKMQVRSAGSRAGDVSFEDLRKLRDENYRIADEARAYEKQGNGSLSDEGWAARALGGAIREEFAARSPASAAANADYTFWKTLHDTLDPVAGRPKSTALPAGVTGGARTVGALVGGMVSPKTAFVMGAVVPWVREQMASPAWQLADAQSKMKLAAAMKAGDIGAMKTWMLRIAKYGPKQAEE